MHRGNDIVIVAHLSHLEQDVEAAAFRAQTIRYKSAHLLVAIAAIAALLVALHSLVKSQHLHSRVRSEAQTHTGSCHDVTFWLLNFNCGASICKYRALV